MRRRSSLALALAAVALAGCASPAGGDGAQTVAEAHVVSDHETMLIAGPVPLRWGIILSRDEALPVEIRLFGPNGARLADGVADSASIRFADPAVAAWTATGPLSGTITAGPAGETRLFVDAYRAGTLVFTSARQPIVVR